MKKLFLILAATFVPAAIIVNSLHAQHRPVSWQIPTDTLIYAKNDKSPGAIHDVAPASKTAGSNPTAANLAGEDLSLISKKAIKNFRTSFGQAETIRWYTMPDGFIAYCRIEGNVSRVYYDRQGSWRYTIQDYNEKKLPAEVRATVKRTYYDFSICGVQEIKAENKIFHIVYIKDETCFKILRLHEGEMDILKEYMAVR